MFPANFAQFKRWVKTPGACMTMLRHDWFATGGPLIGRQRRIIKIQSNAIGLESIHGNDRCSWLHFDKACCYRFDAENGRMTVALGPDGDFSESMEYQLSVED